jgi:hypothetical protein
MEATAKIVAPLIRVIGFSQLQHMHSFDEDSDLGNCRREGEGIGGEDVGNPLGGLLLKRAGDMACCLTICIKMKHADPTHKIYTISASIPACQFDLRG